MKGNKTKIEIMKSSMIDGLHFIDIYIPNLDEDYPPEIQILHNKNYIQISFAQMSNPSYIYSPEPEKNQLEKLWNGPYDLEAFMESTFDGVETQ